MALTKHGQSILGVGEALSTVSPYFKTTYDIASGNATVGGTIGGFAGGAVGSALTNTALRFMPDGKWKTGLSIAGNLFLGGKMADIGKKLGNKIPIFKRKNYDYLNSYPSVDDKGNFSLVPKD